LNVVSEKASICDGIVGAKRPGYYASVPNGIAMNEKFVAFQILNSQLRCPCGGVSW
jgi:hypothetical protein